MNGYIWLGSDNVIDFAMRELFFLIIIIVLNFDFVDGSFYLVPDLNRMYVLCEYYTKFRAYIKDANLHLRLLFVVMFEFLFFFLFFSYYERCYLWGFFFRTIKEKIFKSGYFHHKLLVFIDTCAIVLLCFFFFPSVNYGAALH